MKTAKEWLEADLVCPRAPAPGHTHQMGECPKCYEEWVERIQDDAQANMKKAYLPAAVGELALKERLRKVEKHTKFAEEVAEQAAAYVEAEEKRTPRAYGVDCLWDDLRNAVTAWTASKD